ncbi:hypothetical protein H5410_044039 [Solanum commersonii]|uniref:Uncharacterized protein n=1 Tax=Solanum commersonii TaxID=4109 RepID=A0A9J5Y013_SOLCO|nr:hypothetical protein H5410_044039 [Solanum commersonii]
MRSKFKITKKSMSESRSPKTLWTIAHKTWQNRRFTCSGDRLTWKMECFGLIQITKKCMDYSIRKLRKSGVYLFRGSFDLEYGMFWPSKFQITKKSMDYSTQILAKYGFTCFGIRLTLKMGCFGRESQLAP